jgi:hypothetical protein
MKLTQSRLEATRERADKATAGRWYYVPIVNSPEFYIGDDGHEGIAESVFVKEDAEFIAHARQDIPLLLAEVERLRRELSFIANVDLTKNAVDIEHVAVSVKCWALNVLDGVNHDD